MIDQYAFLTLAVAHEDPPEYQFQGLKAVQWQKFSSHSYRWFLSLVVSLAIVSVAQSAQALVQQGDSGAQVTQVQQRLRQLGYFNANVTGFFGTITRDAVIRFQRDNGLVADGVVGPLTLAILGIPSQPFDPTPPNRQLIGLGEGDRGPGVEDLQRRLRQLGYFDRTPTEIFGPITRDAVIRLQRDNGFTPTGIVTEETLFILNNTAVPLPQPLPNVSLAPGDFGAEVTALQERLRTLGYYLGQITGYFDVETEVAVRQFQRDQGIAATGIAGSTTLVALNIPIPSVPSVPQFPMVLRLGDQGASVTVIQRRLTSLGFYTGPINGFFDLETQRAVISFQRVSRITPTGEVGPTTASAMGINLVTAQNPAFVPPRPTIVSMNSMTSALALGSTGVEVRKIQRRLRELNYYSGPINGFFDQATETALILFQRANGITETGVAGPTTQTFLFNVQPTLAPRTRNPVSIRTVNTTVVRVTPTVVGSSRIQQLQERLRIQGLYNGPIHGVYDTRTQQAVAQARNWYGPNADIVLFGGL